MNYEVLPGGDRIEKGLRDAAVPVLENTLTAPERRVTYYHFDFYSQALSKLQRAHAKYLHDVERMHEEGGIETVRLVELFEAVEDQLCRASRVRSPARGGVRAILTEGAEGRSHWPTQRRTVSWCSAQAFGNRGPTADAGSFSF